MDPKSNVSDLVRERKEDTGKSHMKMEAEIRGQSPGKGYQRLSAVTRNWEAWNGFSLRTFRRNQPC